MRGDLSGSGRRNNQSPPPPYSEAQGRTSQPTSTRTYGFFSDEAAFTTRLNFSPVPSIPITVTQNTPLLRRERQPSTRSMTRIVVFILILFVVFPIPLYYIWRWASGTFGHPTIHWTNVHPAQNCSRIGTREYNGVLSHMPEGHHPFPSCSSIPVFIHSRLIKQPASCWSEVLQREERTVEDGNQIIRNVTRTITKARWMVDFGEADCIPKWDAEPLPEQDCNDDEYGTRIYTAFMSFSQIPPGLDALPACQKTPAMILGRQFYPHQCSVAVDGHEGSIIRPIIRAQFIVTDEPSCQAVWSEPKRDETCTEYGTKRYTSFLENIPAGLDGMELCWKKSQMFFGEEKKPDLCQKVALPDGTEKIVASWLISRNVPECYTHLKDVQSKGCVHAAIRRIEGKVMGIGEHEDWHRMCITTPLSWSDGRKYLPVSCEQRNWYAEYTALYDVLDSACVQS